MIVPQGRFTFLWQGTAVKHIGDDTQGNAAIFTFEGRAVVNAVQMNWTARSGGIIPFPQIRTFAKDAESYTWNT